MKKKILLFIAIISVLACMLVISVSAAEPSYKDGEWIYAADGTTKLTLRDTDGNPLIWYMNGDELKYVRADQTDDTQSVYVKYSISAGGSGFNANVYSPQKTLKDIDIYDNGTQIECSGINSQLVLFNMEKLDVDALNGWLWGNKNGCCTLMRGIYLPSTLKAIGQEGFTKTKLVQIWNIENTQLVYLNNSNFAATSTLTQEATNGVFKCPQTFQEPITVSDSSIRVYILNPVSTFNTCQKWYQFLRNCKQLEKVYASAHYAIGFGEEAFRETPNQYITFITGTIDDATNMRDNTQDYYNGGFKASKIISYDEYLLNQDTYDNSTNQAYIVYGYNYCDAFYDGVHSGSESLEYEGQVYLSKANVCVTCENCGEKSVVKTYENLFTSLGYSHSSNAVIQGFAINKDLIVTYKELYKSDISFGLVVVAASNVQNGDILNATNNAIVEYTNKDFDIFEMKISNIAEENQDKSLYLCAYVIIGDETYYLSEGQSSKDPTEFAFTYNNIVSGNA